MQVLILAGDGVGPEITKEATKILTALNNDCQLNIELVDGLIGGDAYDKTGVPLPRETLVKAKKADAILLGAVGGNKWNNLRRDLRPEQGLLGLRQHFDLFANLRPAILYADIANSSTLKPEVITGLDLMIVRELVSGIYFGTPRGITTTKNKRYAFNTASYTEEEISRIANFAFSVATKRNKKLCSVDKANVLEVSELWRNVVNDVAKNYPHVELSHMYIDNAVMQLVANPKQFDVIVTANMFGDILSDCASQLTGSIGMLPSASLNADNFGMYEPIHGSAPDIAGQNVANPLATILSVAMLCKYSFNRQDLAIKIDNAIKRVLSLGYRTKDIAYNHTDKVISTSDMGDLVVEKL